jgi:hypothetical protein
MRRSSRARPGRESFWVPFRQGSPIEQNDEWLVSRRYLSEESMRPLLAHSGGDHDQYLDLEPNEGAELIAA